MSSDTVFGWIATYLIHSTILLSLCWLLLRWHRATTPALEERAWKLAAIAGLVTTLAQAGLGDRIPVRYSVAASNLVAPRELDRAPEESPASEREWPKSKWKVTTSLEPLEPTQTAKGVDSNPVASSFNTISTIATQPAAVSPEETTPLRLQTVAVIAAVAWSACGLLWLLYRLARTYARVCAMPLATSCSLHRTLEAVKQQNGVEQRIDLRLDSDARAEPLALGLFRWTIVLPCNIAESLSDEEIRSVLSHEIGHLVRRDFAWKLAGHLLCTMAGFQPLNFVARRNWERASEHLCDQWATEHGASPLSLAKSLTQLAERRRQSSIVAVSATGSKPMLVQRIERLLAETEFEAAWQSKSALRFINAIGFVAALAVMFAAPSVRAKSLEPPMTNPHPLRAEESEFMRELPATAESERASDVARTEFEAWSRLDRELEGLLRDLEVAMELAVASGEHVREIETLSAAAAAIERRRDLITTQFGTGENQ